MKEGNICWMELLHDNSNQPDWGIDRGKGVVSPSSIWKIYSLLAASVARFNPPLPLAGGEPYLKRAPFGQFFLLPPATYRAFPGPVGHGEVHIHRHICLCFFHYLRALQKPFWRKWSRVGAGEDLSAQLKPCRRNRSLLPALWNHFVIGALLLSSHTFSWTWK